MFDVSESLDDAVFRYVCARPGRARADYPVRTAGDAIEIIVTPEGCDSLAAYLTQPGSRWDGLMVDMGNTLWMSAERAFAAGGFREAFPWLKQLVDERRIVFVERGPA